MNDVLATVAYLAFILLILVLLGVTVINQIRSRNSEFFAGVYLLDNEAFIYNPDHCREVEYEDKLSIGLFCE